MNEKLILTCQDLTSEGIGVCKHEGRTFFVPNLLVGEEARVHITKKRRNFYEGVVVERLKDSNERVKPKCRYYYECGGCHLQHMSYKMQLEYKKVKSKKY